MSQWLEEPNSAAPPTEELPTYIIEVAKSGRAECKKCDCKIENKCLRVGVILDGEWGLFTRWQHLDCTVFHKGIKSVEELDGYNDLSPQQKVTVKERFILSASEVDEDMQPIDPDELVRKAWEQPLEPSPNLLMPLLAYQKEGLGWMTNQEQNEVHGGILADEMGMGKTIQAIALMLQNRPDLSDFAQLREWAASDARHAAPTSATSTCSNGSTTQSSSSSITSSSQSAGIHEQLIRCGTLIVLPTVAIRQWQTEIARFTKEGSLTVKVYHGSDRNTSALDLTKTDIVLTSYKILEIEYRKATAGTKVTCRVCQKKFYPDKLRVHRKYFCGESAQRTEAQALTQKKKARTGAKTSGTSTSTRPEATTTNSKSSKKNSRKRPRSAASNGDCEEEENEEDGGKAVVGKRMKGSKNARRPASGAVKKKVGGNRGKGTMKGGDRSDSGGDSSLHSSDEGESEEDKDSFVAAAGSAKGRGRVNKTAGGTAAASASAIKSPSAVAVAAGGKKKVVIKTEPIDSSKKRGGAAAIKAEPEASDVAPVKKGSSRVNKSTVAADAPAVTPMGKRGAVQKAAAGADYWPDIDAPDSSSSGVEESAHDADCAGAESSGSDIDAPTSASATTRRTSAASTATKAAPVASAKAVTNSRSTKGTSSSAAKSATSTAPVSATPLRAPTRRAAAQGQKKYIDDTRDSDFDVSTSSDDEERESGKKKGSNRSVALLLAAEEEELEVDSEFEVEAEDEKEADSSDDSESSCSDAPTESEEEGSSRGRQGRGSGGNSTSKASVAKKSAARARSPSSARSRVSPAVKAKAKSSRANVGNGSRRASANGKAAAKVGSKRPVAVAKAESDDDDVAWESGSDAGGSASGSEEGGGDGGGSDSEVERDIQQALLEAAAALKRSKQGAAVSVLHQVSWFRIILDEAHLIKDRSTSTAKAVFNLTSLNKWCLTGTPLQNRVGELYSLIRFLRVDPHAFYYCRTKGCDCKSLHYRFTKSYCDECHHSVIQHYCHFNKHILNPIKRSGYVADGRRAMLKLKQQVLDEILLRRTKTTRAEDIQLPPRIVTVRSEKLDVKEEDFYSALYTQSQAQFNTYLQSGTVLNNYAHIFDILIRLRQAVDHPYLVIYSEAQVARQDDSENYLNLTNGNNSYAVQIKTEPGSGSSTSNCDLCHEPCEDPVRSASCGHTFCRLCITDYIGTVNGSTTSNSGTSSSGSGGGGGGGLRCPDCDQPLTIQLLTGSPALTAMSSPVAGNGVKSGSSCSGRRGSSNSSNRSNGNAAAAADVSEDVQQQQQQQDSVSVWDAAKGLSRKSILDKVDLNLFQSSTKIEALMEELHKMQSEDLGAKAIVFSQFVNMLDLISYRLQRGGLQCVKLSGSMTLEQRDKCITAFKADPDVKVMLISLKAGGVALNLTVASRIFLMDPWWNPAAEMQAIDRTHRIGQHKPIYATRFIIENTIEERILRLQEKKKLVFDGTVGGDSGSMSKLTVDDMRFLFN